MKSQQESQSVPDPEADPQHVADPAAGADTDAGADMDPGADMDAGADMGYGPDSDIDARMAEILAGDAGQLGELRRSLRDESSAESEDLLERLGALEFVDSLVGDGLDMPEHLGDYRIKGVLGRGGMGTVYLAWQESLEREVALKVLAPRFSTDLTMRKRFRSEARASAAMHHQHIVPIYDYGEAQGHLYFAMELVHGVSLDRHISAMRRHGKGCLEPLDAARRFAGVADALALAHKRQILHRDVKPGNIMVHRDGTLALVDFGLSKFMNRKSMNLTSVGGFLGTLHYSPPEQARSQQVTPSSDLYSLGVTIFESVTGQLPLSGESTEAMLQSLLNQDPTRLRQVLPKAPRDLESVLEKLLHKDPRDRYADGEALAMDLRRVAEGEPIRIRGQTWLGRHWRRAKRKPVQSAAIATTVILLLVSLVFLRQWFTTDAQLDEQRYLRQAYGIALREPGWAFGPHGVLTVLTGLAADPPARNKDFDDLLVKAERARRSSDEPEKYRAAYYLDMGANRLLEEGRGLRAWNELNDILIEKSPQSTNFQMDEVAWLELYPLYLGRAIAALTESVGDPLKAREDLQYASFVRPGAFLPRLLRQFLDWQVASGGDGLVARVSELLRDPKLGAEYRRAAGSMLLAFADIAPPAGAHLMRFGLDYVTRKQLHEIGRQWLADDGVVGAGGPRGLEIRLANGAREALLGLGDVRRMDTAMRAGRRILAEEISAGSRLHSWGVTYDLLADQPVDRAPLVHQVDGALHLLVLAPNQVWLSNKRRKLYAITEAAQKSAGVDPVNVRRLHAMLDHRLGGPEAQQRSADAWAQAAPRDPEAMLCRFRAQLLGLTGRLSRIQLDRLAIDGVRIVQAAADPGAFQVRLVQLLRDELAKAQTANRKRALQQVLGKFGGRG